jgi:flagellar motor switch/type III secretory pathway protein FliN
MAAAPALPEAPPEQIPANAWQEAAWLSCCLRAEIAVNGFTVSDLLTIEVGSIVDTGISTEANVTLNVNGAPVGCGKLDLIADRLAVRVTELV